MDWTLVIVLLAWMLNAFMDSIDHMKRGEGVYELWHVLKTLSYGLLIGTIVWLRLPSWWSVVLTFFLMWVLWELAYVAGITFSLYRVDNEWKVPLIRKLFRFHRAGDSDTRDWI